ncbi:hypothetical protein ACIBBB_04795 [Streptomyces sp. NPDC051217]|uniref:hypothetical protein n=1 Tax=Streptomyces sp. NPDC051217 TaxID=3365644 RepID=UPI0037BA61BB
MGKRGLTVLGTIAAAFMLTITPASASGRAQDPSDTIISDVTGFFYYERSCLTSYSLRVTSTKAVAAKGNNGRCDGDAWLRVMGDTLGEWRNHETSVTVNSPSGKFRWAYVKGCGDCYAYIVNAS